MKIDPPFLFSSLKLSNGNEPPPGVGSGWLRYNEGWGQESLERERQEESGNEATIRGRSRRRWSAEARGGGHHCCRLATDPAKGVWHWIENCQPPYSHTFRVQNINTKMIPVIKGTSVIRKYGQLSIVAPLALNWRAGLVLASLRARSFLPRKICLLSHSTWPFFPGRGQENAKILNES